MKKSQMGSSQPRSVLFEDTQTSLPAPASSKFSSRKGFQQRAPQFNAKRSRRLSPGARLGERRSECSEEVFHSILHRDSGICRICGLNCLALLYVTHEVARRVSVREAEKLLCALGFKPTFASAAVEKGGSLWLPFSTGLGASNDPKFWQTLCQRCHQNEIYELRKRVALGIQDSQNTLWHYSFQKG